jgi:hypothetical protein
MSYLTCRQVFPFPKALHHKAGSAAVQPVERGMRIGRLMVALLACHGSAEDEEKAYYEAICREAAEFKTCTCRYPTK